MNRPHTERSKRLVVHCSKGHRGEWLLRLPIALHLWKGRLDDCFTADCSDPTGKPSQEATEVHPWVQVELQAAVGRRAAAGLGIPKAADHIHIENSDLSSLDSGALAGRNALHAYLFIGEREAGWQCVGASHKHLHACRPCRLSFCRPLRRRPRTCPPSSGRKT